MVLNISPRAKNGLKGLGAVALIWSVAVLIPALVPSGSPTQALVAREKTHDTWILIQELDIMSGATIPPDVNVVFHVPKQVDSINREVLLGQRGKTIRYWGYCYPENDDPSLVSTRSGFKGLLFLSERERAVRIADPVPRFSLRNLPTKEELLHGAAPKSAIRHQIDFFHGGQLCYIMSEGPLAIGLDDDGDRLNNRLEKDYQTDPLVEDSDADGIADGIETAFATNPLQRDTDLDGLIDGIEDANWNGIINKGETDPRTADSDRDDLCDGQCRKRLRNGQVLYIGEDRNLNGIVDEGETDPNNEDSDNDGILDLQEYLVCLSKGEKACK